MSRWGFFGEIKYALAGAFGSKLLRSAHLWADGELENVDIPSRVRASGHPVIYAFWHGRLMVPSWTHRDRGVGILISRSADGEYVARMAEKLGFHVIRGSSTRGGEEGFRLMLDCLRSGRDVAVTPDGPVGPRYEVKKGMIYLARASGAAIVPVGIGISRYKQLASWDEFRVPLPGTYVLAHFGEPVWVGERSNKYDMEEMRVNLEVMLNDLTADCERRVHEAGRTRRERVRLQGERRGAL